MKRGILLFCSIVVALLGYSCSSDDNSPVAEDEVDLIGQWQLEAVDFTAIEEDAHPIYQNDFCIIEYIAGYEFKSDGLFIFLVTHDAFGTNSGYSGEGEDKEQVWDWTGDATDFSLNSLNPALTNGVDFGLKPTNIKTEKINNEWVLTFDSEMFLGSSATFTLVKDQVDTCNHRPTLTYNGEHREPCGLLDSMIDNIPCD